MKDNNEALDMTNPPINDFQALRDVADKLAEVLQEHHNRGNTGFYSETELYLRTVEALQKFNSIIGGAA